jgi:hypothetical protein
VRYGVVGFTLSPLPAIVAWELLKSSIIDSLKKLVDDARDGLRRCAFKLKVLLSA